MGHEKIAKNLKAFREGIEAHDRDCEYAAYGVGLSYFDIERLGLEEGEILWGQIRVINDGGQSGTFRICCLHQGDGPKEVEKSKQVSIPKTTIIQV
jgi:hypothetical protein